MQLPIPIPISMDLPLDGRVLAFAVLVTAAAGIIAGLVPALRASHVSLAGEIRGEGMPANIRRRRWTLRDSLVAGQIAVTMLLLVCGGMVARSLLAARTAPLGFRPDGLAMLSMDLQMARYDAARSREFFARALERARAIPGVDYAAMASNMPFSINFNNMTFFIPGHDRPGRPGTPLRETEVGPDYFQLLNIPILEGRAFEEADTPDKPRVAIVNQAMARRYWPGESAIGKVIRIRTADGDPVRIVGISSDYRVHTVGEALAPYIHLAYSQRRTTYGSLLVHTRGDAEALLAQLRRELVALEPNVVFFENQTMTRQVSATLFPVIAGAWVVGVTALVTMVLAGIGLYGAIAYAVARRSREIGIRMALGARPAAILGLVMNHGIAVALAGIGVGAAGAVAAARFLASALYGVSAADPAAWASAAIIVLVAAMLANFLPARRAVGVDPTTALRAE